EPAVPAVPPTPPPPPLPPTPQVPPLPAVHAANAKDASPQAIHLMAVVASKRCTDPEVPELRCPGGGDRGAHVMTQPCHTVRGWHSKLLAGAREARGPTTQGPFRT